MDNGYLTVDPGVSVIDETGRPLLSPQAVRLPKPPDLSNVTPSSDLTQSGSPAAMQGNPVIAPTPMQQGQDNLPKYSIPSDRYRDIESQMPQRDDPKFQQHGLAKLGNIIASIGMGGPFAPLIYDHLKQIPYQRAEHDWQNKLAAIRPEVQTEEEQNRITGENKRASAQLDSTDSYRKAIEEDRKSREASEQRKIEDTESRTAAAQAEQTLKDKRTADKAALDDAFRKAREKRESEFQNNQLDIEKQRLAMEAKRLNKEASDKGIWSVEKDSEGKPYLFNNKTREITDAPERGINKPGDYDKQQAKILPIKAAVDFANTYIKKGKFTGADDEALLEKYFELAKTSSGFRMTKPQQDMLIKSRGLAEGAKATGGHLAGGTYFGKAQRQEIVDTMNALAKSLGISSSNSSGIQGPGKILKVEDAN